MLHRATISCQRTEVQLLLWNNACILQRANVTKRVSFEIQS